MLSWLGGRRRLAKEQRTRRKLLVSFNTVATKTTSRPNPRSLFQRFAAAYKQGMEDADPPRVVASPLSPLILPTVAVPRTTTSLDVLAITPSFDHMPPPALQPPITATCSITPELLENKNVSKAPSVQQLATIDEE